jgi:hypothetical protein
VRLRRQPPDGPGPLLAAQAVSNRRARSGVAGTLRSPSGSVAAPLRGSPAGAAAAAGTLAPHPAATGAPPSAGGRACKSGPAVPLAPGILSPSKDLRQGARLRRGAARWRKRHPLSSDLRRRTSAPIEGNGEVSRLAYRRGWRAAPSEMAYTQKS